jgi:hypothetical protein
MRSRTPSLTAELAREMHKLGNYCRPKVGFESAAFPTGNYPICKVGCGILMLPAGRPHTYTGPCRRRGLPGAYSFRALTGGPFYDVAHPEEAFAPQPEPLRTP